MMKGEKKYDEILRDIGEQSAVEEFDWIGQEHNFSEKYKKQKEALMAKTSFKGEKVVPMKRKWSRTVKAMVASVAVLILLPATVFAAYKLYTISVKDENYAKQVMVAGVPANVDKEIKPVDVKVGYVPEGLENTSPMSEGIEEMGPLSEDDAPYGQWENPQNQAQWMSLKLIKVDINAEYLLQDLGDKQEFDFANGTHALLGKELRNYDDTSQAAIYLGAVFYDEQGYIIEVRANGIGEEELKKVMDNIVLEETAGKGIAAESLAKRTKAIENAEKRRTEFDNARTGSIDEHNIYGEQEVFSRMMNYNYFRVDEAQGNEFIPALDEADLPEFSQGEFEITVDEIKVLNSATEIKKEDVELPALYSTDFVDEEGNLVPYEREFGEWGDGVNKPIWTPSGETELANRKLLSLKVKIKNKTGENAGTQIQPVLVHLRENGGTYERILKRSYREFMEAVSLYSMDIHGEGNHFTYIEFAKDEEKVITMTFFVDEDELNSAFLLFEGLNQEDVTNYQYVDVRQ